MPHKTRISLDVVRRLPEGATAWDGELKGFGVRRQSDTPAYFVKTRIKGRQRWMTIGRHGAPWTPDTARREALRLLAEAAAGRDASISRKVEAKAITLKDVAGRFMTEHGPKLKPRTRDLYQRAIDQFIVPSLGRRRMDDITETDTGKFHTSMKETPRQANVVLTVLSSILSWAMDRKQMPRGENPCSRVKRFSETTRERYLSTAELTRVAEALDAADADGKISIYALAAIRLLILTGARMNEILTLEWTHVSLDHATLVLPDSKTGRKTINLSKQALAVLESLPRLESNRYVIVGHKHGTHLVNVHSAWNDIRKAAGVDDVRVHDLRHSFASFAVQSGASLPVIGKLLGHNQARTTQRYAHIADTHARDVNAKVGDVIGDAMGKTAKRTACPP